MPHYFLHRVLLSLVKGSALYREKGAIWDTDMVFWSIWDNDRSFCPTVRLLTLQYNDLR